MCIGSAYGPWQATVDSAAIQFSHYLKKQLKQCDLRSLNEPAVVSVQENKMRLRRIQMRAIPPEGYTDNVHTFKAQAGSYFLDRDEEAAVEQFVKFLEQRYPLFTFRMVKIGRGKYNFVYSGLRKAKHEKNAVDAGSR